MKALSRITIFIFGMDGLTTQSITGTMMIPICLEKLTLRQSVIAKHHFFILIKIIFFYHLFPRINKIRPIIELVDHGDLRKNLIFFDLIRHVVQDRTNRRRCLLRKQRNDDPFFESLLTKMIQRGSDRWRLISHRKTDQILIAQSLLQQISYFISIKDQR